MFTSYVVEWWQLKKLQARCFVPDSKLTSGVLPEASCFASLSLKSWSQKCRLKTSTNCCAVLVFDWFRLQWLRFNQHHHKVSTLCCTPNTGPWSVQLEHCCALGLPRSQAMPTPFVAELTRALGGPTIKESQGPESPHHCHLGRLNKGAVDPDLLWFFLQKFAPTQQQLE